VNVFRKINHKVRCEMTRLKRQSDFGDAICKGQYIYNALKFSINLRAVLESLMKVVVLCGQSAAGVSLGTFVV